MSRRLRRGRSRLRSCGSRAGGKGKRRGLVERLGERERERERVGCEGWCGGVVVVEGEGACLHVLGCDHGGEETLEGVGGFPVDWHCDGCEYVVRIL